MKMKFNCPLPEDPDKYDLLKEETLTNSVVRKFAANFQADVVEKQDALILSAIREIGGEMYQHITIDKDKVFDALNKATPKKVIVCNPEETRFRCPTCMHVAFDESLVGYNVKMHKYCRHCGQRLDWDIDRESEDEEDEEKKND